MNFFGGKKKGIGKKFFDYLTIVPPYLEFLYSLF